MEELIADVTDDRAAWAIRLQAEREVRGWSKYEMARRLFMAAGISGGNIKSLNRQIRQWEQGIHFPRDWRTTYTVAFGMEEDELFGNVDRSGRRPTTLDPLPHGEEEDVERRELLESLAALGIGISPVGQALESIRSGIARTFESDERQQIAHWEETAVEHGYAYMAAPPERFVTDLAVDLVTLRLITKDIDRDSPVYKEWCRIGSVLAGLMGKTLSNLGQTREARHWWQTAQAASDSSTDVETRLWVRGERLIHGLYERRSPHLLIRHANDAMELGQGHTCAGLAHVSTGRAQALVLAGMNEAAERELSRCEQIFSDLPGQVTTETNSVFGWAVSRLAYTQTWVSACGGDIAKADTNARRALQIYPASDNRTPVQVKLMRALACTQAGDITAGISEAQAIYEVVPAEHRTTMVTDLARRVLSPISLEARRRSDVMAYEELLATSAQSSQKAIKS
ncbi:hypothetical protein [Actinomadura meridiana]|uniref:hypothetical protein n=1 Tax=Actinomadura meridiana TaxID=559626 RepID=UPI0031EE05F3